MHDEELLSGRDFVRRQPRQGASAAEPRYDQAPRGPADEPAAEAVPHAEVGEDQAELADPMSDAATAEPAMAPAGSLPGTETPPPVSRWVREAPLPPLSRSFLAPDVGAPPPPQGWRAALARIGVKTSPTSEQMQEYTDLRAIARLWPGPRTAAIANPKGGASKTPSTIALAASYARYGGTGALAWCNNVTRGTLAWRIEQGIHTGTVLDLLRAADSLTGAGAQMADLARFVRHQTEDRFDALCSAPDLPPDQQKITPADFDAIWDVVRKYYRVSFIDSGNEETAENWLRMIDRVDALVVPLVNRRDHAEAARQMLTALRGRDDHAAQLAQQAVVIVSEVDPTRRAYTAQLVEEFGTENRDVVVVPHDNALSADWIRIDALAPATRRAYLRAAAAVAQRFDQPPTSLIKENR